jgi:hypothetical protein
MTGQRGFAGLLAAFQVVIGYEWFISGINKLAAGDFPRGLAGDIVDNLKDVDAGWFATFLRQEVLPHSIAFGYLVEYAEVMVGLLLLTSAAVFAFTAAGCVRWPGLCAGVVAAGSGAAVGAVCMNACYYLFSGGGWPGVDPAMAYGEGMALDLLLSLLSVILALANALMVRVYLALAERVATPPGLSMVEAPVSKIWSQQASMSRLKSLLSHPASWLRTRRI